MGAPDIEINAQVMKATTTADGTVRVTIDLEGTDDMAAGYFVILAREKAAIKMAVKAIGDEQ